MAFYFLVPRRLPFLAAIAIVLAAYTFFATHGKWHFHSRTWDLPGGRPADAYYASLAEGFLRGQLSMAHQPGAELMAMPNPYDYEARAAGNVHYLWDASYFNGRYYLYFSPLPALVFYMPFRVVYGKYPGDQLAGAVFAAWAFVLAALFVRRALPDRAEMPLLVVLLGLGNVVPFIMVFSRTYEVATLCGMAMSATWAWSLLRYLESPATSRLLWMSIWLGLAIAARPNLGVLIPVMFLAIANLRKIALASIPLAIIGGALLAYNYARFHDPFEFGHRYQLTYFSMAEHRVCGVHDAPEAVRLISNARLYVFTPPDFTREFPFVNLPTRPLDAAVSYNERSEEVGGLAPLIPLAFIGSFFALRRKDRDPATRAARLVIAGGWLALLGLAACWYVTARYEVDFMLLIATGAIVSSRAKSRDLAVGRDQRANRTARFLDFARNDMGVILLASWSILIGTLLGFKGTGSEFARMNPELFRRLSDLF